MPVPERVPAASVKRLLATCAIVLAGLTPRTTFDPALEGFSPAVSGPRVAQSFSPAVAIPPTIRIGVQRGSSYDVSSLPLETYVARVLAGEAAAQSPPAALEALAITVRTFALANLGRHRADGFDLCDQTHCQVLRPSTAATERAAGATAGQVLVYRGALASVYYSASCGGFTERPSGVWPGADDPPYLPARVDAACEGEPAWTDDISRGDLSRALAAAGFRGTLRDARIAERDISGRVSRLALDGLTPGEISGADLRTAVARTLGALHVKSAQFNLRRTGDTFRFDGRGYGHGVGMCVIGSVKLADAGETAAAILARYFPGTEVYGGGARTTRAPTTGALPPARAANPVPAAAAAGAFVSLPEGDEGEQNAIAAMVSASRDELARALGVPPPRVSLRFHATTDEYERATKQSWFTFGSVVNQEIHFVPLASLRARGVLERTIRRELVHVMVDAELAKRPTWVREGAALYFSDASRDAGVQGSRAACPADLELLQPLSAGALADAYARARSCFVRQLQSGRTWRDVR